MPKRHRQPQPIDILRPDLSEVDAGDVSDKGNQLIDLSPVTSDNDSASLESSSLSGKRHSRHRKKRHFDVHSEDHSESPSKEADFEQSNSTSEVVDFDSSDVGDDGNQYDGDESVDDDSDDQKARRQIRRAVRGLSGRCSETDEDTSEDDDDATEEVDPDSEVDGDGLITVDFGVYDMKPSDVNAVTHLIEQFVPGRDQEVDRDLFGSALLASPYTCVVKVGSHDTDDKHGIKNSASEEEEEAEIYGVVSVLDLVHCPLPSGDALMALYSLFRSNVQHIVSAGIPPTDFLLSTEKGSEDGPERSKCLLLVMEYLRNVPLELTVQILDDLVTRVEENAKRSSHRNVSGRNTKDNKHMAAVQSTHPCMYAVLANVQRTVDAFARLSKLADSAHTKEGGTLPGAGGVETFDITRYTFWREEDEVLYAFRDERVAAMAYSRLPQYDGQPEADIPVSILYVLQHGALRQALAEMKKRQTCKADVVRY